MSIRAGQSLLHYRVVEKVGAGGMGEVYRAQDTRLGRDVAIKLLPAELRDDPHRLARLEREARMLASLNHPHVATVHGLEQAEDGARILVMELVEGESLAARLERGALPLQQVYELGAQISEALGAAHARGIVHRDLKPGNIMLTRQGIKLIDFGLAKSVALPSVGAHIATQTLGTRSEALTGEGALVGTFQYMSPEQLEGQEADARADIFALGAVLYEMATGRKAFHGKSAASLIAAILSAERPSIARDLPLAPPALDRLVRTCLARDPDERWQSARDVGFQLNGIAESRTAAEAAAPGAGRRGLGGRLVWVVATVALLAAVFFAFPPFERPARSAPVVRFPLSLPDGGSSDFERISPDGRHASMSAFAGGRRQIWLRSLDDVSARPLPGTEGAMSHFWSPDSRFIGFFSDGKLKKLDVDGGLPEPLCDAPGSGPAQLGAWGRDGTILFGISEAPGIEDGLYRVSADGGTPAPITLRDESGKEFPFAWPGWPSFLPDGRHFVSLCSWSEGARGICVTSLETERTRKLLDVESYAEYSPPGYLLYSRRGVLVAHPFDLDLQRVRGEPVPIADGMAQWGGLGIPAFSASQNGVLLYSVAGGESRLVLKDRQGVEVGQVGAPADYDDFRLAPDGSHVAATITDPQTGSTAIWLIERARNVTTRFTLVEADDMGAALWSPDGRSLVFGMARDNPPNLHRKSLGGGEVRRVAPVAGDLANAVRLVAGRGDHPATAIGIRRPTGTCGSCRSPAHASRLRSRARGSGSSAACSLPTGAGSPTCRMKRASTRCTSSGFRAGGKAQGLHRGREAAALAPRGRGAVLRERGRLPDGRAGDLRGGPRARNAGAAVPHRNQRRRRIRRDPGRPALPGRRPDARLLLRPHGRHQLDGRPPPVTPRPGRSSSLSGRGACCSAGHGALAIVGADSTSGEFR